MLAWAMNMGFAASPANTTVATSYAAPFGMGLGDELFMLSLLLCIQMIGGFR